MAKRKIMASEATLRDLFAAEALAGLCANPTYSWLATGNSEDKFQKDTVDLAFEIADKMLTRRERPYSTRWE